MNTLFNMDELEPVDDEPTVVRFVVVLNSAGGRSYYRRTQAAGQYASDDFIELDTSKPIPTHGVKLPHLYKSIHGARKRVSDLYNRHKHGGEGINIWVCQWERKQSENHWSQVGGFK